MLDYKSMTFNDMPPVTTYIIEDADDSGPFGAKEVGQGPLLPMMPAGKGLTDLIEDWGDATNKGEGK